MARDTIGALAKAAGVGVETVRYYQRRGLLPEPARPPGEVRRYGEEDVKRLRFIRSAQAAGFTLNEIGELIALDASDDRTRGGVRRASGSREGKGGEPRREGAAGQDGGHGHDLAGEGSAQLSRPGARQPSVGRAGSRGSGGARRSLWPLL